jgi:Protein of unknown function (DUF1501)
VLNFLDRGARLCDGFTRREWLALGGLSAFGLSSGELRANPLPPSPTRGATFGRARACIVMFHLGGPAQHETWDPKPDAPAEVRGPFRPIMTRAPGVSVCELMPRTATVMDRICVIRSLSTNDNAHSSSGYWMLTGVPHQPTNTENAKLGAPNDWPSVAALIQRLRGGRNGLPASITLPDHIWNTGGISWPGQDAGFLGRSADPWRLHCDPSLPGFELDGLTFPADMSSGRLENRMSLLDRLSRRADALERGSATEAFDSRTRQALDLLRAGPAKRAFRIEDEPVGLRERYGMTRWGQSVLLARRLVEAGVSLVQVNWTRMSVDNDSSPAWDNHNNNAGRMKDVLMPVMDRAYSALLEDLAVRGLLDSTLVVWIGEFGRSPKINPAGGRDHWGHVFSGALAGGGVRGGQVVGSSDRLGGHPREGRVQPQDLTATVFHLLGHEPNTEVHDPFGRPLAISRGDVIRQVLS